MNWKEQFNDNWNSWTWGKGDDSSKDFIQSFISTEIIEKLIDEIPEGCLTVTCDEADCIESIKQQLRERWLNDQKTTD